ncbi:hypothetical protein [Roseinatronobacter sp.]
MKLKLYFVIPSSGQMLGSTYLRGTQLCKIAQTYLGEYYECEILPMPARKGGINKFTLSSRQLVWAATCPKDAIYFITKQCIERLGPTAASILQSRARAVLFDYIDADMQNVSLIGADIHICASHSQLSYMTATLPQNDVGNAAFLRHGFDTRLSRVIGYTGSEFRAVYCGAEENTYIPNGVRQRIDFLDGSSPGRMAHAVEKLGLYNAHYCIRSEPHPKRFVFKPMTKLANAAACGSIVIANINSDGVIEELGEDYPYLVRSVNDHDISEVMNRAAKGVGSPEWELALKILREVKLRFSPSVISDQLHRIITSHI